MIKLKHVHVGYYHLIALVNPQEHYLLTIHLPSQLSTAAKQSKWGRLFAPVSLTQGGIEDTKRPCVRFKLAQYTNYN